MEKTLSLDYLLFYQDILKFQNLGSAKKEEQKILAQEIQKNYGIGTQPKIVIDDLNARSFIQNLEKNNLDNIFRFLLVDIESMLTIKFMDYMNELNQQNNIQIIVQ